MLRRFFPKGTNFSNINDEDIKDVQDWMNNYPRKILTGARANLEIDKEIGFNLLL
jgi:IS30 family transposase